MNRLHRPAARLLRHIDRLANLNAFIRNFDNLLFSLISLFILVRFRRDDLLYTLAAVVTTAGLVVWWAAKLTLGRYYSLTPQFQGLVTRGIYSKVRHPIYAGSCLVYVGWACVTRSKVFAGLAVVMIAVQAARMFSEEKMLLKRLGPAYAEYKRGTWF